ncbi:hypothetical protein CVU75_01530 [Candidatus Dependentiae bacterium HGW-Dependentiae-1]|nr:MAG: hypothetical protein CVU75_01530 [Candidatus Dependentiae bacterium HGW-Dependentiae-1]
MHHQTEYKKALLAFLLAIPLGVYSENVPYQALVVVPIAELVGDPMQKLKPGVPPLDSYQEIPLDLPFGERKPNPFPLCPRVHQLLLHEKILVTDERGQEVRVTIPNLFFVLRGQTQPQCTYWTLKKNIVPLATLSQETESKLPESISFATKKIPNGNTISLIYPVTDPITGMTFSAGTRFVYEPALTTKNYYLAYVYDAQTVRVQKISLPKKYCMPPAPLDSTKKIKRFVSLLHAWAHLKHGSIAYVWGGRSFTSKNNNVLLRVIDNEQEHYTIPDQQPGPKSGFDCSSLIATAAQLSEIPYFFKNTTTISSYLRPLKKGEDLEAGDIILTTKPNHVMVVSDLKKHKLIEARTLAHGYGKVHEIPIQEEFQNIKTYAELLTAYHQESPINRLRKDGSVIAKISRIQLFKLASVWE